MSALLAFVVMLSAQDLSWGRVEGLARGADVQVVMDTGASFRGHLSEASADSIQLALSRRAVSLDRAHVRRVSLNRGTHRKRTHVIVGLLAGGIAGAAIQQAACGSTGPECTEAAPLAFYPGAAAGMAVAAALPSGDWETIYIVP